MKDTTQMYRVEVTIDDKITFFYRTMPTKPTTTKGIKAQNNKLLKWAERENPTATRYEITPV